MTTRFTYILGSLKAFLHLTACILSVAMLLSFPATRLHDFGTHFRTPEVRRVTERQTCVAQNDHHAQERAVRSGLLPKFFIPTQTVSRIVLPDHFESRSEVSLPRLLNRLKLNRCGSSGPDPLLQA